MNWETTDQVATRIQRHPVTVRLAAESGQLHGHQPKRRGRWKFAPDAVDAFIQGLDDRAQIEACGCARLRVARRTA